MFNYMGGGLKVPTVRISREVEQRLRDRKFQDDSWNDVIQRVLNGSKVYRVEDVLVEVKGDGTTVRAGNPVHEKVIQD